MTYTDTGDRPSIETVLERAGEVLSQRWNAEIGLYLQDPIRSDWGRHTVLLCHVDGPAPSPDMVVVKVAASSDGAIFNEWSVLEWLGSIPALANDVPQFHAGDQTAQLIVLEDLGGGPSLQRMMQVSRQQATDALVDSQQLTARAHSATRGRSDELDAIRRSLPDGPPPPVVEVDGETLLTELDAWGVSVPPDVRDDVEAIASRLDVPDDFRCLTFNDACPVNRIVTAQGVRALDLEMAAFRHPMIDGAYAMIGHLRCTQKRLRKNDGLVIPPDVGLIATEAYRTAILDGYPEYQDRDRFDDDLAAAAAVWMVMILNRTRNRVTDVKAAKYFSVTSRQRTLAALDTFGQLASSMDQLPALASWAGDLSVQLRAKWPETPLLERCAAFA